MQIELNEKQVSIVRGILSQATYNGLTLSLQDVLSIHQALETATAKEQATQKEIPEKPKNKELK